MSNHDIEEIHQLIAEIWEQLKLNEKALNEQTPFQTDGLEDKVKDACSKVTALPKEKALAFEPELTRMIEFLTDLSAKMQQRQAAIKEEATSLNQRERAMKAYKQSPKTPPSDENA